MKDERDGLTPGDKARAALGLPATGEPKVKSPPAPRDSKSPPIVAAGALNNSSDVQAA